MKSSFKIEIEVDTNFKKLKIDDEEITGYLAHEFHSVIKRFIEDFVQSEGFETKIMKKIDIHPHILPESFDKFEDLGRVKIVVR